MALLQFLLQQGDNDKREKRLAEIEARREAMQGLSTLNTVLQAPKNIRGPLLDYYEQNFAARYGTDMGTLRDMLGKMDDEQAGYVREGLASLGVKIGKGEMDPSALLNMTKDPIKALEMGLTMFKTKRDAEQGAETNRIFGERLPKGIPTMIGTEEPGTGFEAEVAPRSRGQEMDLLSQQEQALLSQVERAGAYGGVPEAQKRGIDLRLAAIKRRRDELEPKEPGSNVALAYRAAQGDQTAAAALEQLTSRERQETQVGLALKAAQGDPLATKALGLLREPRQENEADRVALELFDTKYEGLSQPQRAKVNKALQERRVEVSAAGVTAKADAALDVPVSVSDAKSLRVPVGTTLRQVRDRGIVPPTAAELATAEGLKGATAVLDRLDVLVDKTFKADGLLGRLLRAPRTNLSIMLQTDPDAVLYESLARGSLSSTIRALGEKGTLAEGDVVRALELIPKLTPVPDTRTVAKGKLSQLKALFREIAKRGVGETITIGDTEIQVGPPR